MPFSLILYLVFILQASKCFISNVQGLLKIFLAPHLNVTFPDFIRRFLYVLLPSSDVHFVSTLEPLSNAVKRNARRCTIILVLLEPAPFRISVTSSFFVQNTLTKLLRDVSLLQIHLKTLNITDVVSSQSVTLLVVKGSIIEY